MRRLLLAFSFLFLLSNSLAETPVIGGSCPLGTSDVQIGGKHTHFFLKCEQTADGKSGGGVWVVKSRAAAASSSPSASPPKLLRKHSNICEQVVSGREGEACSVSPTCLQPHADLPSSYLQCDETHMVWLRKDCHDGTIFNFENQACVVPKRLHSLSRQSSSGLVCTYSSCSPNNPCNIGSCNNGYCCSSGNSIPISFCPNGGVSIGNCGFGGGCSPGYSCLQGSCCPSFASVPYNCPGGGSAVGNCVNGGCASGYTCSNNQCCPTQNPFVCVDGTQAVGACVDGKCGSNYSCSNGLCCSASSATPRCLDGSPAVGACIPSCTGDMCGSVQVTYSCGSGYTCTTGNICCQVSTCPLGGTSIGPAVNGLCPSGYVLQGSQCCSTTGLCPANTTFIGPALNGMCPAGTLTNGVCCSTTVTCAATLSNGPCNADGTCPTVGYGCDTANQYCCPLVDFNNPSNIIGPAIGGLCPAGYTVVLTPNGPPEGECVSLQSIPGICAEAVQAGPCMNGQCAQAGFTCFIAADVCCPTTTRAMHRMPVHGSSLLSKPISHLAPSRGMATSCPDGTPASSACINGLCGAGLVCINDVCCALSEPSTISKSVCPDGQPAVSGCFADGQCGGGLVCVPGVKLCCPLSSIPATPAPPNSLFRMRPIGARCDSHSECVGNADGLSTCDFGVCRCTPAAYAQGARSIIR